MKKEFFKAFTLLEIMISAGIILTLTLLSIAAFGPARRNAIAADTINAVAEADAKIRIFYSQQRRYPDTLSDLVTAKIVPHVPSMPGGNEALFYQKDYEFINLDRSNGSVPGAISLAQQNNPNWRSRESAAMSFLSALGGNGSLTASQERQRQYYAIDLNLADDDCSYLGTERANIPAGGHGKRVAYRLGVPLPEADGRAKQDATPCSDRFFDIVVQ